MGKLFRCKTNVMNSIVLYVIFTCLWANCNGQRQTLYISTLLNPPFLMKAADSSSASGPDAYEGFTKDLADELSKRLGYNYNFQLRTEKEQAYGMKLENGSWTGLIGDLINSRVGNPMIIADLSVTRARAEVVDFSVPFLQFRLSVLLEDPNVKAARNSASDENDDEPEEDEEEVGDLIWFSPFTTPLWILFILAIILLILLIYFVEKFVYQKTAVTGRGTEPPPPEKIFGKFSERVFGAPTSVGARFLQVTLWIFLIIFISAYTANFAADQILDILDTEKELPVQSLDELVKQDKIKYGMLASGATFQYFENSKDPQIQNMYKTMTENNQLVKTYERGITKIEKSNGTFALIMEAPAAKYAGIRKPCNLALLPEQFGPKKGFAIALQKDSNLLRPVNLILLDMIDSGFLGDLEDKWFKDNSECDDSEKGQDIEIDKDYDPLTVDSMAGVFCLIGFAAILVIVIAVIEIALISKTPKQNA